MIFNYFIYCVLYENLGKCVTRFVNALISKKQNQEKHFNNIRILLSFLQKDVKQYFLNETTSTRCK